MTTVLKIQGSKGEKNLSYKFQDQNLDFVTENCDYYFIQDVSGTKKFYRSCLCNNFADRERYYRQISASQRSQTPFF